MTNPTPDVSALLLCPVCGSLPYEVHENGPTREHYITIECGNCGLAICTDESRLHDDYPRAADIWNTLPTPTPADRAFQIGQLVGKKSGSSWTGKVVGFYSTDQTPVGYCVESIREPGSVQIYPERALAPYTPEPACDLVETVAKSIATAFGSPWDWFSPQGQEEARTEARTAIAQIDGGAA